MIIGGLVIILLAIGYTQYVSPIVIQGEAMHVNSNLKFNATEVWNKLTGSNTDATVIMDSDAVSCSVDEYINGSCGG